MLICCSQYRKNPKYKMNNKKKKLIFDSDFNRAFGRSQLGKALPSRNGRTDTHMTEVTIIFGACNRKRQVHLGWFLFHKCRLLMFVVTYM